MSKKQIIKTKFEAIPEQQIKPGVYLKSVGHKYVTIINTLNGTWIEKQPIDEFYQEYCV